jgi:hypothetical protein
MSKTETPADALDAAVEEARMNVVAWGPDPARDSRSVAMGEEVDALIAAVEARAVARERARECVWTRKSTALSRTLDGYLYHPCGGNKHRLQANVSHCEYCGGRVRVAAP